MKIGIRHEDKNPWERRTPLTPADVAHLASNNGIRFVVQPAETPPVRAYSTQAYREAGAEISDDLSTCDLVLGVKEMPAEIFRRDQAYLFFSHTIKCQAYNMAMLKQLLDVGGTLFDYELITDDAGSRQVFFGNYAGLAGMIDTLAALGQRLRAQGIDNPFAAIRNAHEYDSLAEAQAEILEAGGRMNALGFDERITPLVIGIAGYGNVSSGVQQILNLLPTHAIAPQELPGLRAQSDLSGRHVYTVIFKEEHMVAPRDPAGTFELQDYYDHPEKYASVFDRYTPHLDVLVNCIYWTEEYPRLVTLDDLRKLYGGDAAPKLQVIGDISCDIGGSIECTVKATEQDQPCYVYDVSSGNARDGVEGAGPVVMAVDNLPCELPIESSEHFSQSLRGFIGELAPCNLRAPNALEVLPPAMRRATIAFRGELQPQYQYIAECIRQETLS